MTRTDDRTAGDADAAREPDYRFTLANERTFLAWIRTCFGLLAGGVAVDHLVTLFGSDAASAVVSVGCMLLAVVLALGAYFRWRDVQHAMVHGRPLPSSPLLPALAVGSAGIGALAICAALLT